MQQHAVSNWLLLTLIFNDAISAFVRDRKDCRRLSFVGGGYQWSASAHGAIFDTWNDLAGDLYSIFTLFFTLKIMIWSTQTGFDLRKKTENTLVGIAQFIDYFDSLRHFTFFFSSSSPRDQPWFCLFYDCLSWLLYESLTTTSRLDG